LHAAVSSDNDNDAEVLKAALLRTISKRRAKSKQQQAALLKVCSHVPFTYCAVVATRLFI
jgi:hypothetical protein